MPFNNSSTLATFGRGLNARSAGWVTGSASRRFRPQALQSQFFPRISLRLGGHPCVDDGCPVLFGAAGGETKKPFYHPLPPVVRGTETRRKASRERLFICSACYGETAIPGSPQRLRRGRRVWMLCCSITMGETGICHLCFTCGSFWCPVCRDFLPPLSALPVRC
jgi:hypothetical protein